MRRLQVVLVWLLAAATCLSGGITAGAAETEADVVMTAVTEADSTLTVSTEADGTLTAGTDAGSTFIAGTDAESGAGVVIMQEESYSVVLPQDVQEGMKYPTVYVLPEDGYQTSDEKIADFSAAAAQVMQSDESLDMILVFPKFAEGEDFDELLPDVVQDVEEKYPAITDARFRGLYGARVGGYMAYEHALIAGGEDFFAVGATAGNFTGEDGAATAENSDGEDSATAGAIAETAENSGDETSTTAAATVENSDGEDSNAASATAETSNHWLSKGSVFDAAQALQGTPDCGYSELQKHFYYLEAPNGEAATTAEGGTTDIGAAIEMRTNPYWQYGQMFYLYSTPDTKMCEYTVTDGKDDDDYIKASFAKVLNRFSLRFTENLFSASISAKPQAVKSSDSEVGVKINFGYADGIASYLEGTGDLAAATTDSMAAAVDDGAADGADSTVAGATDGTAEETADGTAAGKAGSIPVNVTATLLDPDNGEELASESASLGELQAGNSGEVELNFGTDKLASGLNTTVSVSAEFLGFRSELGTLPLVRIQDTGTEPEEQLVDLMGDWYFKAYKEIGQDNGKVMELDSISDIKPKVYESWGVVQPALGWWTEDFDTSLNGNANYGGYAWYVRTFDMPEEFPKDGLELAVGCFDEANEVYINGHRVGSTGMTYADDSDSTPGVYDGSNPWDVNCVYELDSSVLNYGGSNTIAVRMCNSSGGGGWYQGPVGIYSKEAYEKASAVDTRFTVETYQSKATGAEETYRVYLPEDYDTSGEDYPVMVLLHGINSQSKTYEIDHLDRVLDEAIAAGEIAPMVVILPDDPTKTSFWQGQYGKMVTDDLIPLVIEKYRVKQDPESWMIAGCSMGGAGAYSIGLAHPELFRGVISFYGALNYVNGEGTAASMSADDLRQFSIWMACGNADMYNFYIPQENISRTFTEKGVPHYHYVGNGTHSTEFYLPRFVQAVKYTQEQMGIAAGVRHH